eukprot:COSAG04_NODE_1052_length_8551_cov_2.855301_6_plen_366_part_00
MLAKHAASSRGRVARPSAIGQRCAAWFVQRWRARAPRLHERWQRARAFQSASGRHSGRDDAPSWPSFRRKQRTRSRAGRSRRPSRQPQACEVDGSASPARRRRRIIVRVDRFLVLCRLRWRGRLGRASRDGLQRVGDLITQRPSLGLRGENGRHIVCVGHCERQSRRSPALRAIGEPDRPRGFARHHLPRAPDGVQIPLSAFGACCRIFAGPICRPLRAAAAGRPGWLDGGVAESQLLRSFPGRVYLSLSTGNEVQHLLPVIFQPFPVLFLGSKESLGEVLPQLPPLRRRGCDESERRRLLAVQHDMIAHHLHSRADVQLAERQITAASTAHHLASLSTSLSCRAAAVFVLHQNSWRPRPSVRAA